MTSVKDFIKMISSLCETDKLFAPVLTKCLNHCMYQVEEAQTIIAFINQQMSKSFTYVKGLKMLELMLPHCSSKILESNCILWMQMCLKKGIETVLSLQFIILKQLINLCNGYQDFNKIVVTQKLKEMVEHCLSVHPKSRIAIDSLQCLKICLITYRSACIVYKTKIENYIFKNLNSSLASDVVDNLGICFVLLNQVGGSGSKELTHIENYSKSLEMLTNTLYSLYNQLFQEIDEFEVNFSLTSNVYEFPKNVNNLEMEEKLSILYQRIRYMSKFLLKCFENSYSSKKLINPERLLNVIKRGLSVHLHVNLSNFNKNLLSFIIQEHQCELLLLLKALIGCLKQNFLRFTGTDILLDCLTRTSTCECYKNTAEFRIMVYDILKYVIINSGQHYSDNFYEKCIAHIKNDINEIYNPVLLNLKSSQHNAKKQKLSHDLEQISDFHKTTTLAHDLNKENLCLSALSLLQSILKNVEFNTESVIQRRLFDCVMKPLLNISVHFYNSPYTNKKCRLELYKTFITFFYQTIKFYDLSLSINILNLGLQNIDTDITNICYEGLLHLERICQPLHASLYINYHQNDNELQKLEKTARVVRNEDYTNENREEPSNLFTAIQEATQTILNESVLTTLANGDRNNSESNTRDEICDNIIEFEKSATSKVVAIFALNDSVNEEVEIDKDDSNNDAQEELLTHETSTNIVPEKTDNTVIEIRSDSDDNESITHQMSSDNDLKIITSGNASDSESDNDSDVDETLEQVNASNLEYISFDINKPELSGKKNRKRRKKTAESMLDSFVDSVD